jgi:nitroreductase
MELPEMNKYDKIAKTDYEIYPLLSQRYSPRVFKDKKITAEELHQLFEAVRWSASSNNIQPWRFILTKKGTKAYNNVVNCLSEFNQKWVKNAPVLVLCGYKKTVDKVKENFHALHDLGLSLGNMTVQAQSMDIALHHMAGLDWQKAHEVFKVPDDFHIATALAIGYYGGDVTDLPEDLQKQELAKRERKPQSEFVFKDSWK